VSRLCVSACGERASGLGGVISVDARLEVDDPDSGWCLADGCLAVLGLLPSMLSLNEIATDLTVSVNTVKSHVRSIYTKLGVSSRRTAVLSAHEHGLLEHPA